MFGMLTSNDIKLDLVIGLSFSFWIFLRHLLLATHKASNDYGLVPIEDTHNNWYKTCGKGHIERLWYESCI